ncbi:hypothetical protein IG631_21994 [Alternaria alternata]|nr:hypothetical protein IG631_21994 [Alternaria alternata]
MCIAILAALCIGALDVRFPQIGNLSARHTFCVVDLATNAPFHIEICGEDRGLKLAERAILLCHVSHLGSRFKEDCTLTRPGNNQYRVSPQE